MVAQLALVKMETVIFPNNSPLNTKGEAIDLDHIFRLFITIFTTNVCENVHPVYGAGIRTHDLWNVSLFP